jgi:hypothetical protein
MICHTTNQVSQFQYFIIYCHEKAIYISIAPTYIGVKRRLSRKEIN